MTLSVYLADLRHNFTGVLANDCMPLGIAYMKAVMDARIPSVHSRLFAYPDRLEAAIKESPPSLLMLTNYMWNERLSLRFARLVKLHWPNTIVVLGGPNLPNEHDRRVAYLAEHPEIDIYALGEGDFLASEIVERFFDSNCDPETLLAGDLRSCIVRRPDGSITENEQASRTARLDEIPSPWLTGVLDEFFDGKLAPLWETNRGCPFQCTFCVQGDRWYTKVNYFDVERLTAEIEYIGEQIHRRCPSMTTLRIADSNFGMFDRDVEVAAAIGEVQRRYGWPLYIDATTGKNRPERVIEAVEKAAGALVVYQSVQSLDDETLRRIKRSNISTEAYDKIMVHVRGRGLRSLSDLILGLPGETLESHVSAIRRIVDSGTHEMHNFQAMMLKGSELEAYDSRAENCLTTRYRVLPKNFGVYAGERVFDLDEIVIATSTMTFEDYLEARKYHFVCSIFWNNSWFQDLVGVAASLGIPASRWLDAVKAEIDRPGNPIEDLVAAFDVATRAELFESADDCIGYFRDDSNFARLCRGEIGDNLMYRFRALASFVRWRSVVDAALRATRTLLLENGAGERFFDFESTWTDLARYVELRHAHGSTAGELLADETALFRMDVAAWLGSGGPPDARPFRFPEGRLVSFTLPETSRRELTAAIETWGTNLMGLTKGVTRIRPSAQVRVPRVVGRDAGFSAGFGSSTSALPVNTA